MLAWLNQSPTLYKGKRFHLVYFGLFSAIASFVGFSLFFYYLDSKSVLAKSQVSLIAPLLVICIWCCGRIGHLIVAREKRCLNETGFYSQAAILGSLLVIGVCSRVFHFPYLITVDAICFALPLTLAIARLGCFNYGCCYGKRGSVPWTVRYVHPDSKVLRIAPERKEQPLHPVQLYASVANLGAFLLILSQLKRELPEGAIVTFLQFFYVCKRVVLDRFRDASYLGGKPRYWISSYTLAMLLVACGFLLLGCVGSSPFLLQAPVPLRAQGFWGFLLGSPSLLGSVALASLLVFIGYGYHGKKLGTFVNVYEN